MNEGDKVIGEILKRRFFLSQNVPVCPVCPESAQIQLVSWLCDPPAKWRCRTCGHRFAFEPLAERAGNEADEGQGRLTPSNPL